MQLRVSAYVKLCQAVVPAGQTLQLGEVFDSLERGDRTRALERFRHFDGKDGARPVFRCFGAPGRSRRVGRDIDGRHRVELRVTEKAVAVFVKEGNIAAEGVVGKAVGADAHTLAGAVAVVGKELDPGVHPGIFTVYHKTAAAAKAGKQRLAVWVGADFFHSKLDGFSRIVYRKLDIAGAGDRKRLRERKELVARKRGHGRGGDRLVPQCERRCDPHVRACYIDAHRADLFPAVHTETLHGGCLALLLPGIIVRATVIGIAVIVLPGLRVERDDICAIKKGLIIIRHPEVTKAIIHLAAPAVAHEPRAVALRRAGYKMIL